MFITDNIVYKIYIKSTTTKQAKKFRIEIIKINKNFYEKSEKTLDNAVLL